MSNLIGVKVITEGVRGCGYRKVGGVYLRSDGLSMACGRLPIPLGVCPCCGQGIKFSRGWTWINMLRLLEDAPECKNEEACGRCALPKVEQGIIDSRFGLLWIGRKHYTVAQYLREANNPELGVSRRLPNNSIPRDLVLGETWVALAHLDAIPWMNLETREAGYKPGIFAIFKPTSLEVVVDESYTQEEVDRLIERGLTPIIVQKKPTGNIELPLAE